jgi:hypothetical protein
MGDDETIPATAITEDFAPRHRYVVVPETGADGVSTINGPHLVRDELDQVVAWLPGTSGGNLVTRAGTWAIAVEHAGHGWTVAARDPADGRDVAVAHPRLLPHSYDIRVPPDGNYALHGNVITDSWTLRDPDAPIAHLTAGRYYVNSIVTFDSPFTSPPLALLLSLALELDRLESTVPGGWGAFSSPR